MFSWLTGSGVFKEEQFEEDKERLTEFYRDKGYIDFEIKDVQFVNPTPRTMIIRFIHLRGHPIQGRLGQVHRQQTVHARRRSSPACARSMTRSRAKGQASGRTGCRWTWATPSRPTG